MIGSCGNQVGIRTAYASDEQVAEVTYCFAAKVLKVAAFLLKAVNEGKGAIGRARGDGVDELFERIFRDDAEKFADFLRGNCVAAVGARLFE